MDYRIDYRLAYRLDYNWSTNSNAKTILSKYSIFYSQYFGINPWSRLERLVGCYKHNKLQNNTKKEENIHDRINSNYILKKSWVFEVCFNPGQVFQAFAFASSFLLQPWSGSRVARLPIWTIHWSSRFLSAWYPSALVPGCFFITHQDYRKPPLSEHGRLRQPRHVLSSNIIREEAIPVFDWQGVPCKVCISVLETEYTTFRILQLIHPWTDWSEQIKLGTKHIK